MRVGVLGPLEVVAEDGATVRIGGARLRLLLIRLALDAGRTVTADALADALWPDGGPSDRANALQSLVSRLRQTLPRPAQPGRAVVRLDPGGYRLDLPPEDVDAVRFERLARDGRQALRDGQTAVAAARLREALGLWRGEPLAEAADAPFATPVIVRLSELRLAAAEDRADAELQAGADPADLTAELEALTAAHPLRERLRGLLIRALHADGRQAEALTAYEEFRKLLADELGADPGPELQAAHLAVLRGEQAPRPAPAAGREPRGNLRAVLTAFIGREREQARIGKQLEGGRLVTLVGPGGAGKTRLAAAAAAGLAGGLSDGLAGARFPGGVWLVELASVTDPGQVPPAVVSALGLREVGLPDAPVTPRDAVTRLVEALAPTETLLILDNCEHLADAAARLADELLGRCPRLRVVATSREPLGIPGEQLCVVPPLDVPAPGASAHEAMSAPAVRLFADRAAAVRPDFAVTDANVDAVTEVCRRLDGLPLAIELAAARLRALPVEELAARLGDRFALLKGGSRTALPRHRTLHAVVAWSWDVLDEDERRMAERLSVFPGTITPESAGQMGAPPSPASLDRALSYDWSDSSDTSNSYDPLAPPDPRAARDPSGPAAALQLLTALVDKSLLQVVDGTTPRYRMLETIREYGLERLADAGPAAVAQARAAHAAWFLQLAERAEPHLRGPGQVPWVARLVAERDNLLAALRFACESGDADTAVRLGAALSLYWTVQSSHAEAATWLRLVLDVPGEPSDDARTVAAAFHLVNAILSGSQDRVADTVVQARAWADAGRAGVHPAAVLLEPAMALAGEDDTGGLAAVDRHLPRADPWARAMLWLIRSFLDVSDGDMRGMLRDLEAAVRAFREVGERWGLAHSLTYLAYARTTFGDFDDAIVALEESVRLLGELDPTDPAVLQRVSLATARAHAGDRDTARAELLELVSPGTRTPATASIAYAWIALGDLARHGGNLKEAARQYAAATEDLGRRPSAPQFRAMLDASMAHLAVTRGDPTAARQQLAEAISLVIEAPDPPIEAGVAVAAAHLRLSQGAPTTAAELLGVAHTLRGAPDTFDVDVTQLRRALRDELGEPTYQAAYDRGRELDRGAAFARLQEQVRGR